MISELEKFKLIIKYRDSHVLTALGQKTYSNEGVDPRSWVRTRENRNISFSEACALLSDAFGEDIEIEKLD